MPCLSLWDMMYKYTSHAAFNVIHVFSCINIFFQKSFHYFLSSSDLFYLNVQIMHVFCFFCLKNECLKNSIWKCFKCDKTITCITCFSLGKVQICAMSDHQMPSSTNIVNIHRCCFLNSKSCRLSLWLTLTGFLIGNPVRLPPSLELQ